MMLLTNMLSSIRFYLDYFALRNLHINFILNQNIFSSVDFISKGSKGPTFQIVSDG